ncbi:MAG: hypothetical protein KIT43_10975 [Bauldia sp.]|nr:hypothetical protein [Bauldia sp.]MCW5717635.1 hypothetical protein [Bauldia sp.]MCW5929971.1 hypothetical protein [Chitinophagaceae bacterium]
MSSAVLGFDTAIVGTTGARSAARYDVHAAQATGATALHPYVLRIATAFYALMIATFWVGFVTTGPLAVAMVIVTVCLVAYVGLPWSMAVAARRFNARHGLVEAPANSFRRFLTGHFETGAGNVSGFEALVLVVTVPACLLAASIAFAVIYNTLA